MIELTQQQNVAAFECVNKLNAAIRVMEEVEDIEKRNGKLVNMRSYGRFIWDRADEKPVKGMKVACGTVCCAAGWCSLDPKAREAFGLTLSEWNDDEEQFLGWLMKDTNASDVAEEDGGDMDFNAPYPVDRALGVNMDALFGTNQSIHSLRMDLGLPPKAEDINAKEWVSTAKEIRKRLIDNVIPNITIKQEEVT